MKSALGAGLPRQFEGRLEEFAPFGRNSKGKASIPYNLEIVYYGPYNLVVASAHGTPSPAGSVNHLETGNVMECTVSPAEIVTDNARHRCTGWTGFGDVPASGVGTAVSFTATERNSKLTWNWASEYHVSCTVSGAAEAIVASDWVAEGETYDVAFAPTVERFRVTLGGDAEDVVVDEATRCVHIPADRARQVSVEIVPALWALTTAVPVPYEWLDGYPNLLAAHEGDYEAFANAAAANGRNVWECYVAGLDPTNAASEFTAAISISNDVPYIIWSPNLNTNGIVRKYTILGKGSLTDTADWAPTNSAHRFFKVKVEMP